MAWSPLATAAGLATLDRCGPDLYPHLEWVAATISQAASTALSRAGVPHVVQHAASMFSVFLTDQPVPDYATAATQDVAAHRAFFHAMLAAGVHLPPSAFEAWFVSAAHDERAVDRVLDALPGAARAAATIGA